MQLTMYLTLSLPSGSLCTSVPTWMPKRFNSFAHTSQYNVPMSNMLVPSVGTTQKGMDAS